MSITAIVDTQTNEFVPAGHVEDARFIKVDVSRNPDPVNEKYSGDPQNPIAPKSGGEIAAGVAALQDADAAQQFDGNKVMRAKAISDLAWRLGKAPGSLTAPEIAAERLRIITIYKSLP